MTASISETVHDFATTLSKGIKASMRGILDEWHEARVALEHSVGWGTACTAEDDQLRPSSLSDPCLPEIDDPSNLVLRVLAIEAVPISGSDGSFKAPVVHYTWNKPTREEIFHEDCIIGSDVEAAIEASGYASWPLESLKKVFDTRLVKILEGSDGNFRTYEDEHVHVISDSKACADHAAATDGNCRVLVISGQPFDKDPADILSPR